MVSSGSRTSLVLTATMIDGSKNKIIRFSSVIRTSNLIPSLCDVDVMEIISQSLFLWICLRRVCNIKFINLSLSCVRIRVLTVCVSMI